MSALRDFWAKFKKIRRAVAAATERWLFTRCRGSTGNIIGRRVTATVKLRVRVENTFI
jgi:hypothetical protein